jgi:hypothetical protein
LIREGFVVSTPKDMQAWYTTSSEETEEEISLLTVFLAAHSSVPCSISTRLSSFDVKLTAWLVSMDLLEIYKSDN